MKNRIKNFIILFFELFDQISSILYQNKQNLILIQNFLKTIIKIG